MKPQKALHLYDEESKKKPKTDGVFAIFEKYDGWYGYLDIGLHAFPNIHSRACREIPSLINLSTEIDARWCFRDIKLKGRLIFEILLRDEREFSTLNGILNRSVGDCQAKNAYLKVHDFVDDINVQFADRYARAGELVKQLDLPCVELARPLAIGTVDFAKELVKEVWSNSGEGVILKNIAKPYSPDKRNSDLMKIKEEVTKDLLVVDMVVGEGKYSATLGTLVVQDKYGKDHHISGMTDAQRDEWWTKKHTILGRVVEVKAMKVLPDGSLREPRFKAIRYDKLSSEID